MTTWSQEKDTGPPQRQIAERAGANLGLITYYFNDREQLWKAAVARAFAELQASLAEGDRAQRAARRPPAKRLRQRPTR